MNPFNALTVSHSMNKVTNKIVDSTTVFFPMKMEKPVFFSKKLEKKKGKT